MTATTTYPRHARPDDPCTHDASLYGRCVDCGLTWRDQGRRADVRRAIAARVDERRAGRIAGAGARVDLWAVATAETFAPRDLLARALRIGGGW